MLPVLAVKTDRFSSLDQDSFYLAFHYLFKDSRLWASVPDDTVLTKAILEQVGLSSCTEEGTILPEHTPITQYIYDQFPHYRAHYPCSQWKLDCRMNCMENNLTRHHLAPAAQVPGHLV